MSMKQHLQTVGKNDEWLTPPEIISSLGEFDLDPCSPVNRPWDTAKKHYNIFDNGLLQPWYGRVWCNPPFNRYVKGKWMRRMSEHGNGILLVPASMETIDFKKHVYGKSDAILFLDHRPNFYTVDGVRASMNVGCSIVLIAYGQNNVDSLLKSNLGPVFKQMPTQSQILEVIREVS